MSVANLGRLGPGATPEVRADPATPDQVHIDFTWVSRPARSRPEDLAVRGRVYDPPPMYAKVLVGTDGSPTAAKAVDRAVDVARAAGAALTILSAGRPDQAGAVVEREAARHAGSGVAIDTRVVDDDPVAGVLGAAADGDYDLLVLGNRGMTGVTRFLRLGSVPNKVVHQIPCTLLIVKTT